MFSQKELNIRQKRWLGLIKDNDCTINHYLGKANIIANALSRKERVKVMSLPKELIKEMEKLDLEIKDLEHKEGRIYEMLVQPKLQRKNKKSQELMIEERRSELTSDEYLSVKDKK